VTLYSGGERKLATLSMTAIDATGLTARTENSFIPLAWAECDHSLPL